MTGDDKLYRVYEYFKNPDTGEYTVYRGNVLGYVKASNSWAAISALGYDGDEYGAEAIDGKQLTNDLEAIKKEEKTLKHLKSMAAPFKKEYDEYVAADQKALQDAYDEYCEKTGKKKGKIKHV